MQFGLKELIRLQDLLKAIRVHRSQSQQELLTADLCSEAAAELQQLRGELVAQFSKRRDLARRKVALAEMLKGLICQEIDEQLNEKQVSSLVNSESIQLKKLQRVAAKKEEQLSRKNAQIQAAQKLKACDTQKLVKILYSERKLADAYAKGRKRLEARNEAADKAKRWAMEQALIAQTHKLQRQREESQCSQRQTEQQMLSRQQLSELATLNNQKERKKQLIRLAEEELVEKRCKVEALMEELRKGKQVLIEQALTLGSAILLDEGLGAWLSELESERTALAGQIQKLKGDNEKQVRHNRFLMDRCRFLKAEEARISFESEWIQNNRHAVQRREKPTSDRLEALRNSVMKRRSIVEQKRNAFR